MLEIHHSGREPSYNVYYCLVLCILPLHEVSTSVGIYFCSSSFSNSRSSSNGSNNNDNDDSDTAATTDHDNDNDKNRCQ